MSLNPLIVEECLTNAMMALGDEIYPAEMQGLSVNVDLQKENFAVASKVVESSMLYECVQNIVYGVENPSKFEKQIVQEWLGATIGAYERNPVLRSFAGTVVEGLETLISASKAGRHDYELVRSLSRKFFQLSVFMDDTESRINHSVYFRRKDSDSFQICESISGTFGVTGATLWDAPWECLNSVEVFNNFLQEELNEDEEGFSPNP